MSESSDWLKRFRQPPSEYRSMPLWVWNGAMTEDRIRTMLGQYAEQGMGGVFVHPRPGLITPYLSERWFELWGYALEQCKRLGLECNVYDENSYPSGFAGGHVPSRIPHAILQYVNAIRHESGPIRIRGELMGAYWLSGEGAQPLPGGVSPDEAVQEGPVLTIELLRDSGSSWLAWFPFVDQMRPEVGETFLEVRTSGTPSASPAT